MNKSFVAATLIALASSAMAQDAMKVVKPDGLTWIEHPVFRGVQTAILIGDPTKAETIVQRVKFPPNYKVPPHTHPTIERVTVISGTPQFGMGPKFDETAGRALPPGGFAVLPAAMQHFAWTAGEAIVQIHSHGPFKITYVNPADDPRNAKQ